MGPFAKKYVVRAVFEFQHEVSAAEVEKAILRGVATEAFAIPGTVRCESITPQDGILQLDPAAMTAIGKLAP
jgi:hypothetical protein